MATNKTIYKTIPLADAKSRTLQPLTNVKKVKVNTIVSNFIQYLKNAHS
jgi:hypothetical protein